MEEKVSKKEYPYEAYCKNCGQVLFYISICPMTLMMITAEPCMNLDGTKPKAGDKLPVCNCGHVQYLPRLRS